ncbi:MAG: hypothetical protein K0S12_964 [Bacteroidetes bacterium]|jgi:hypothetical protein|nr:hypothetical protein [Bacteroidota bacterium]
MYKIKLVLLALVLPFLIKAQPFSGTIEFKYFTSKDTTTNVYLVKDKTVKLDQFGKKSGSVEGSFVFDLAANNIKFVNPKRKVWGEHKSETPPIIKGVCEVKKTSNTKSIQGVKCTEYIVKNAEENTVISYWLASGKYDFFVPLVKLWNRKDKQSIYFNQIKDVPQGAMPMLSEEKEISTGNLVTRLEVTKIAKGNVDQSKLAIPSEYKKFEQ